jgi:hypothetical protein
MGTLMSSIMTLRQWVTAWIVDKLVKNRDMSTSSIGSSIFAFRELKKAMNQI